VRLYYLLLWRVVVTLDRRSLLGAGLGLGAALALPGRVWAQPVAAWDATIDPKLKARALMALAARRSQIRHADVIAITDFAKPSREARFYLLNVANGQVTSHLCAHGRGSDPAHSGWLERFSNEPGSEASSNGIYLTGEVYHGKYGRSLRLEGLSPTNSNALARAIVVHSAAYAEPHMIAERGKLGRSEGCFALPIVSHAEVMYRLGPGRLIYADKV
jgi:hypothetical protein